MAELIDLVVDRAVLLYVGVGGGNVRLRLIIVVIRDEVFDGVIREELLEFAAKLRGERFVMREDERRAVYARDDVSHREGLAGAGDSEQHLLAEALFDSARELVYRLRLIAGRLEIGY